MNYSSLVPLTVKELKTLAKEHHLTRYSSLRRKELLCTLDYHICCHPELPYEMFGEIAKHLDNATLGGLIRANKRMTRELAGVETIRYRAFVAGHKKDPASPVHIQAFLMKSVFDGYTKASDLVINYFNHAGTNSIYTSINPTNSLYAVTQELVFKKRWLSFDDDGVYKPVISSNDISYKKIVKVVDGKSYKKTITRGRPRRRI